MTIPAQPGSGSSNPPVDAVGFLTQLESQEDKYWFSRICHAALSDEQIGDNEIEELLALFVGKASYVGIATAAVAPVAVPITGNTPVFLEGILDFKNFKGLAETLRADFKKQVTIVFGANGSGKSSLCEVFKILANHERPTGPLHNVRLTPPPSQLPQFSYKFRTDSAPHAWTQAAGFGIKSGLIKYFDSTIAVRNVRDSVDPGRVVALAPFKLDIFVRVSQLINRLQLKAEQERDIVRNALQIKLAAINSLFTKFTSSFFATVSINTATDLSAQIAVIEVFSEQALLDQKRKAMEDLIAARSSEGLKLLRAQSSELISLCEDIDIIIINLERSSALLPAEKAASLEQAGLAQELLAKAVIPEGKTAQQFIPLLKAASVLCNLQEMEEKGCPLCKRNLESEQMELFKKYHELLTSDIAEKISTLTVDIHKAQGYVNAAKSVDRNKWKSMTTIPADTVTKVSELADAIVDGCLVTLEIPASLQAQFDSLKAIQAALSESAKDINLLIDGSEKGHGEIEQRGRKLAEEIIALEYKKHLHDHLGNLLGAEELFNEYKQWESSLSTLPGLKTRATLCSKEAYDALVVTGFETRLNNEYIALTERPMTSFGVTLSREARQQVVRINPVVGGQSIANIFSEGEQRSHALALFFAELGTAPQKVIIFDDPSTSFDYNFIAGYCERIRDFVQAHPDKQVIILSHHWEFFVQIQSVIKQTRPSIEAKMDVQVMENMSSIGEYNEDISKLKSDIEQTLQAPGEPSKEIKEITASKMRKLIESIVNVYVFCGQRHQYKQKKSRITDFYDYTKVTPLLESEAQTLRDLYAKLSITEHDDIRNAYTVIDKPVFQTRYDEIKNIETAIIRRKALNVATIAVATSQP